MNSEGKKISCQLCNKLFSRYNHLKRHLLTHGGEKPYSCDVCGKSFTRSEHKNRHMKTHTGNWSETIFMRCM